jgi:hypothetical protein
VEKLRSVPYTVEFSDRLERRFHDKRRSENASGDVDPSESNGCLPGEFVALEVNGRLACVIASLLGRR